MEHIKIVTTITQTNKKRLTRNIDIQYILGKLQQVG